MRIKPEEAREIVKYLSTNNGLAPEEDKPVFWEAEHRMFRDQSDKIPEDALQHTCNYCHTIGRVLTQRRTRDDYDKLIAMHIGLFPGAENTFHPRRPRGEPAMPVTMSSPTGNNPVVVPPPRTFTLARTVSTRGCGGRVSGQSSAADDARMDLLESSDANAEAGGQVAADRLCSRGKAACSEP